MNETYTLDDQKPVFHYGDTVAVNMAHLGSPALGILKGKVVGKGAEHIIDMWLVEFDRDFGPTYPYRALTVPHVSILK
jgi:hypothetical protein